MTLGEPARVGRSVSWELVRSEDNDAAGYLDGSASLTPQDYQSTSERPKCLCRPCLVIEQQLKESIVDQDDLARADLSMMGLGIEHSILCPIVTPQASHSLAKTEEHERESLLGRGRTLERTPRITNPLSRAASRRHQNDAAIEVNVHHIEPRLRRSSTFFEDPSSPDAALEDRFLEPLAPGPICASVAEVLERSRDVHFGCLPNTCKVFEKISSICKSKEGPACHESNPFATPSTPTTEETSTSSAKANDESPEETPLATSRAFDKRSERKKSYALALPNEILQQIFAFLPPTDFNSARHTCRSWYISSLENTLLSTMLRRGGWSGSMHRELSLNSTLPADIQENEMWLMSKRISRECALGADWTGNGLSNLPSKDARIEAKASAFQLISLVDFTEAGSHYPGANNETSGMVFTVSACSKFLMAAQGCLVFIYELNRSHRNGRGYDGAESGALRPITSIICPRKVLSCSMDTSSNRDAIAILMDGRMGLVCAVTGNTNRSGRASFQRDLRKMREQAHTFPISRGGSWRNNVSLGTSHSPRSYPAFADQHLKFSVLDANKANPDDSGEDVEFERSEYHRASIPAGKSFGYPRLRSTSYPMPIEASPPTLYAPLCSADDPPRSVALCPQRRCVAFGCSSGIELHWVDALTGEDLNRWFPLTAPSDYLYFLPPRAGIDSAKKLRLVSSQGTPGEGATIGERFAGRKKSSAFWGVNGSWNRLSWMAVDAYDADDSGRWESGSDHYRAVPLSDGYHLLFTDPASGLLCLGSDAPLGGPTKLLRKFCLCGPSEQGSPIVYSAASDLRWGVRVVAAYGFGREQSIWLFSIPGDAFTEGNGRTENFQARNFPSSGSVGSGMINADWLEWWPKHVRDARMPELPSMSYSNTLNLMWPLQVRGQEIGQCKSLVDLAVHSGTGLGITIWAFGRNGLAKTWKLSDSSEGIEVKKRWVVQDGTVREGDTEGDMEMADTDIDIVWNDGSASQNQQEQFDGTASLTVDQKYLHSLNRRRSSCARDADGDILMEDLPEHEDVMRRRFTEYSSDMSFDTVAFASSAMDFTDPDEADVQWEPTDLVEELTGVTRIDIEIR